MMLADGCLARFSPGGMPESVVETPSGLLSLGCTGVGYALAGETAYNANLGSATYGPGTYELQLHPSNGGLYTGQVLVSTNPPQIQYFELNGGPQILTPPLPWKPRRGVCSCNNATGTPAFQNDPLEYGTFQFVPTSSSQPAAGPEPLTLLLCQSPVS
jgi:hypothetical protein